MAKLSLFLVSLLGLLANMMMGVDSKQYDIEVSWMPNNRRDPCTPEERRQLRRVARRLMNKHLGLNTDDSDWVEPEPLETTETTRTRPNYFGRKLQVEHLMRRQLGTCAWKRMCQSVGGKYCSWCSCCGSRRRRNLRVEAKDEKELEEIRRKLETTPEEEESAIRCVRPKTRRVLFTEYSD